MMKHFTTILLLMLGLSAFFESNAQCKVFTKEHCFTQLDGYINTGSYNGAVMTEGEEATLTQTFYEGQEYRLVVCTQESLADIVFFEIINFNDEVIFSSQESGTNIFDFSIESTQMLKIRVKAPHTDRGSAPKKNGCISIVVGFKGTTNNVTSN